MPKLKPQPPTPAPVILVVLPDEIARQIHRQLTQVNDEIDTERTALRPRRTTSRRASGTARPAADAA